MWPPRSRALRSLQGLRPALLPARPKWFGPSCRVLPVACHAVEDPVGLTFLPDVARRRWDDRPVARTLDPEKLGDHLDRLFRAAWALTGSREDAEDLVQETYERVLRRPR